MNSVDNPYFLVEAMPVSDDPMDIQNLAKAAHEQLKGILSQDIIVQQQARINELEANIDAKADFIDATINQLAASDQRIEELEAKLAKALEALEYYNVAGYEGKEARTTLAELKGQKDE